MIISTKKKIFSDVNECRKDHNCHWAAILGIVYQMNLHHDYWKRNIFKMIIAKKRIKTNYDFTLSYDFDVVFDFVDDFGGLVATVTSFFVAPSSFSTQLPFSNPVSAISNKALLAASI